MLISTTQYSQIDSQLERINQIVKIILRYFLTAYLEDDFIVILPYLQITLNNSRNVSINLVPSEVIYNFFINNALRLLNNLSIKNFSTLRNMKREEVEDLITQAHAIAKTYYNTKYKSLYLKPGDQVFLTLYRDYTLRNLLNKKLSQQRAGSFKILAKIRKLVYKLNLLSLIKIYLIVSII